MSELEGRELDAAIAREARELRESKQVYFELYTEAEAERDALALQLAAVREAAEKALFLCWCCRGEGSYVIDSRWNDTSEVRPCSECSEVRALLADPAPAVARVKAKLKAADALAEAARRYRSDPVFGGYGDLCVAFDAYKQVEK